jgi:hypothetical protein
VVCLLSLFGGLTAATSRAEDAAGDDREPGRWGVILVGLPGDEQHEREFRETADQIQKWLVEVQGIPESQVLRLPGRIPPQGGEETAAADAVAEAVTAETMRETIAALSDHLREDDAFWLFTLGHGNWDGRKAWFHVAGRDPSGEDVANWLADIRCREQVMWLTHSSSGRWVKPLSRAGRIIIAATAANDEPNETEFPHALATVARWPPDHVDSNRDQVVTVAEFYTAVVGEVVRRYQASNRLRTEHAQLDDNGDGIGTEEILPPNSVEPLPGTGRSARGEPDGELARATVIPHVAIGAADASP